MGRRTRHAEGAGRARTAARRRCGAGAAGVATLVAVLAAGAPRAEESAEPTPQSAPQVGLDQLLKLPSGTAPAAAPRPVGGASRSEWRARYTEAEQDLEAAKSSLEKAMGELQQIAGTTDNWQLTAPGGAAAANDGPLNYRLRQEIKRSREEIARAERALRDVKIEAGLAGVPPEWLSESPDR